MIYGDIIREQSLDSLIESDVDIMKEYYENEISILKSIIEYQNESSINESYALEILQEAEEKLVENTKKKKSILSKLIDALQSKLLSKKKILQKKINKAETDEEVYELVKGILPGLKKKKDGSYTDIVFNQEKYNKACADAYKKLNKGDYDKNDGTCYSLAKSCIYNEYTLTDKQRKFLEKHIENCNNITKNSKLVPRYKDYFIDTEITGTLKDYANNYTNSVQAVIRGNNFSVKSAKNVLSVETSGTKQELKNTSAIKNKEDRVLCQKYLNAWLTNYKTLENIQIENAQYFINFYTKALDKINAGNSLEKSF